MTAAKAKKPVKKAPNGALVVAKKARIDWEAVERDYRTGKFTDVELAEKYHVVRETIGRRRKKDKEADPTRWVQDLSEQIRQATNALLVQELVAEKSHESHAEVTSVILAAAEANKQVILGHRTRLAELVEDVATAKLKLMTMGETVADIREAAVFVQAVGNLATATKTLIEQERKAHSMDSDKPETPGDSFAGFLSDLSARGSRLPTGATA